MSLSMSTTSGRAWSSFWGQKRNQQSIWVRIKGRTGLGDVEVCYNPPGQKEQEDEALYRGIGAALCSQALVLTGALRPTQ